MKRSAGFTLVEIAVVVPSLLLVIAIMLSVIILMLQQNTDARAAMNATYDTQNALDTLETDITYSSRFLITNDPSPISDPYGDNNIGGSWSYKDYDSDHRVLILRTYASTDNILSETRRSVYLNQLGCSGTIKYGNPVLQYNIVYFVRNSTLYRRILTDTTTAVCDAQYQKQSCPTDVPTPRNAKCLADDEAILTGVGTMQVSYFTNPNDTTAADVFSLTDTEALTNVQSVNIVLSASRQASGPPKTTTLSLRVSKLNQ